jgi:hypothetical protein
MPQLTTIVPNASKITGIPIRIFLFIIQISLIQTFMEHIFHCFIARFFGLRKGFFAGKLAQSVIFRLYKAYGGITAGNSGQNIPMWT